MPLGIVVAEVDDGSAKAVSFFAPAGPPSFVPPIADPKTAISLALDDDVAVLRADPNRNDQWF